MKRHSLRLLVLLLSVLLCGCASIVREERDVDGNEMPWNVPAGWEGQGFGIPM